MQEYTIKEYSENDINALVAHWKESIRGWPPGFQPGVSDWSPDSVRDWLFRNRIIACWLGWLGDQIVGFLKFTAFAEDPEVALVDLFNVHPDYHGKGYGRKLLTHAVNIGIESKVKRIDLFTWPANIKAVPLYKKCGFFWRPNTLVHMYNFLPVVLSNPIVKSFLADKGWYESLRQPVEIKEDDEKYDGCAYHRYLFENDGKLMQVFVDPSTSGIVGIQTDDLSIKCILPDDTFPEGFPSPITWVFSSSRPDPVKVKVESKAPEGLDFDFNKELSLYGEKIFEVNVIPHLDVQPERINWYSKPIECKVTVDGTEMLFKPGIKAVKPFRIYTHPYPLRFIPGEERIINIMLESNVKSDLTFNPEFDFCGGISCVQDFTPEVISISPKDTIGFPIKVKASMDIPDGKIFIGGTLKKRDFELQMKPVPLHVRTAPKGMPVEVLEYGPDVKSISNGIVSVQAMKTAGAAMISLFETGEVAARILFEMLGEPFSSEMNSKRYDVNVEIGSHFSSIICSASSDEFPGIEISRRIGIGVDDEISVFVMITNNGSKPFSGKVQYSMGSISPNAFVVPIRDRIIAGSADSWWGPRCPLSDNPSDYSESWIAWLSSSDIKSNARTVGFIWKDTERIFFSRYPSMKFQYAVNDLHPGQTKILPPVRMLVNARNWKEVQEKALNGRLSKLPAQVAEPCHVFSNIVLDETQPICGFRRMFKDVCQGSLKLTFTDGSQIERTEEEWNIDRPIEVLPSSIPALLPGIHVIECDFYVKSAERTTLLPLIVPMKQSKVVITDGREGEYNFISVNNGSIEFRVAPQYCGTLYWLSETKSPGINLLRTDFPNVGMWTWLNPWFGGIMPRMYLNYEFSHSDFHGDIIKTKWGGHEWEGVRVTVTPINEFHSLKLEFLYLTMPGIPVILSLIRATETAGCKRSIYFENIAFPCPTGNSSARCEGIADEIGRQVKLVASSRGTEAGTSRWAAVYDPVTLKTLGIVASRGEIFLWEAADAGFSMWHGANLRTCPGETVQTAFICIVADAPDLVKAFVEPVRFMDSMAPEAAS